MGIHVFDGPIPGVSTSECIWSARNPFQDFVPFFFPDVAGVWVSSWHQCFLIILRVVIHPRGRGPRRGDKGKPNGICVIPCVNQLCSCYSIFFFSLVVYSSASVPVAEWRRRIACGSFCRGGSVRASPRQCDLRTHEHIRRVKASSNT